VIELLTRKPALAICQPIRSAAKNFQGDTVVSEGKLCAMNRRGLLRPEFWQHPHATPALAATLEQNRASSCAKTMRFGEGDRSRAFPFSRKRRRIAGVTKFFHRANLATRIVRGANQGAEIHHRVLEIARPVLRNKLCRKFPQFLPSTGRISWGANIEKAGENAGGVGFDDGQGSVERENCDCIRRVPTNSG
jgi:hypothetical protein